MVNFVPAWYRENKWKEQRQYWYVQREQTEMDDTVKQIQLFHRNNICDYRIILLSFAPNFRHFLHRMGIFRARYISVFDIIQGIDARKNTMFSFRQLNWPEHIEFLYSPFVVVAKLNGEKYAQVEFDGDGRTIEIKFFSGEELIRKNIYDDRGFLSVTCLYENGKKLYDRYLSPEGQWKLCNYVDGHVEINPKSRSYFFKNKIGETIKRSFKKLQYKSLEDVIGEVFTEQMRVLEDNDIFIVAAHKIHQRMLSRVLKKKPTIVSVFSDRFSFTDNENIEYLRRAHAIVCDSDNNVSDVRKIVPKETIVYNIPPYDTRVALSLSQKLHIQNILLPVDSLEKDEIEKAAISIAPYLMANNKVRVKLFTRLVEPGREKFLLNTVKNAITQMGYPCFDRFSMVLCVDELSVSQCVKEQRLLIDLSDTPDIFLQIACIGMGVPQILKIENKYMTDGENGRVIRNYIEIEESLRYYLDNLANWNRASVASNEIRKEHATMSLINQWKEVVKDFGQ